MKKTFTLFSRLAAVLLTVMMTLPWQAFAEDINVSINLKRGEIYKGEWATHVFKVESQNPGPMLISGNVDIFPTELENDEYGNKQYKIGNIYCPLSMSEGESVIKVQPAMDYDEWDNVSYNTYVITVNVSGAYVAAVPVGDNVEPSYPDFYEPDPNALNNLTIPQGATRDNMVKLAYVWSTGYMGGQAAENFIREWHAVPAECVTLTSSNPSIVAISNDGKLVAQSGTAGQSVTITMSCAPDANNGDVPTGSVSFTLNVVEAGEKDNINLFLTKDYDRIYNGDGYIVYLDELGYYEGISNTIRVMHDLGGGNEENFTGSLRVVSSNEDIVTASVEQVEGYNGLETQIEVYYHPVFSTATISVIYDGDAQYADTTLTFTVTTEEVRYSAHRMELRDKNGNPLTELNVTEGDSLWDDDAFRFYDLDRGSYYCYPFNRLREEATICHHFYWPMHGESVVDSMYFCAPGEDTLRIRYRHYDNDAWTEFKVPVHIAPLVTPVSASASTAVNFATTDPTSEGSSVVFADSEFDKYKNGQLEINTAMTQTQVKNALDSIAFGCATWLNKLPGTVAFNLSQGSGKIDIYATVSSGYSLFVRLRSNRENTVSLSYTPAEEKYELTYNVVEPTAVIIYIAEVGGGSPAPKRAPKAKLDEPKAIIKSIGVAPNFAIAAKQDPDDAGLYYSTFFDSSRKFTLPAGTEAYAATISGEDMILNKVAEGGQIIPADNAFILKSNSASVTLTPTDDAPVSVSVANSLHGTDSEMAAPANCYVLSGHSTDYSVTGVGFYQFSGTLPAHKAYLTVSGGAAYAPKRLRFVFNQGQTATGVENVQDDNVQSTKVLRDGQLIIQRGDKEYNAQGQIVK
ncbi:MAG: hypothetical protein IJ548_04270 [Paludibacteraceae bacterium]|nr:hypothetical protein [Paludibacteraceae bacterium]MBQ9297156.1 hypothetical protein [Paludibacteraceae bacterium]MBR1556500.1 hypothetical protein [Prevotella sp.]